MSDLNILDKLSISTFRRDHNNWRYKTEAALFMTYSLKPTTMLATLVSIFDDNDSISVKARTKLLIDQWEKIIKDNKAAFIVNNGCHDINDSLASVFTAPFCIYADVKNGSFHPKLCIVKYSVPQDDQPKDSDPLPPFYRFFIGSKNLSGPDEHTLEHGAYFELQGVPKSETTKDPWDEIKKLYAPHKLNGNTAALTDIFAKFEECCFKEFPEIITSDFKNKLLPNDKPVFWAVISPFLSKGELKLLDTDIEVYTTASEIKKHGLTTKRPDDNAKEVRIRTFQSLENSSFMKTHAKLYITKDGVYTGSLNYTHSAMNKNSEMLVKIPGESGNILNGIKEYYGDAVSYYLEKDTAEKTEPSPENILKNFIKKYFAAVSVRFDAAQKALTLIYQNKPFSLTKGAFQELFNELNNGNEAAVYKLYAYPSLGTNCRCEIKEGQPVVFSPFFSRCIISSSLTFELYRGSELHTRFQYALPTEGITEDMKTKAIDYVANALAHSPFRTSGEYAAEEEQSESVSNDSTLQRGNNAQVPLTSIEEILRIPKKYRGDTLKDLDRRYSIYNDNDPLFELDRRFLKIDTDNKQFMKRLTDLRELIDIMK